MRAYGWLMGMVAAAIIATVLILWLRSPNRKMLSSELPKARMTLDANDRVLVLAPHPDDEVLGCGGIIQQAVAMGVPVYIAFLTYGDFYEYSFIVYEKRPVLTARGVEGMGEIRHDEAVAADSVLGVPSDNLSFLGYPDFGTLEMFQAAWGDSPPVRGKLSRATTVPYANAVRPGAPYKGQEVLTDLTALIRRFRPTKGLRLAPGGPPSGPQSAVRVHPHVPVRSRKGAVARGASLSGALHEVAGSLRLSSG
jgi:LmbE family N-acetylglucosaminyl deacetylase